MNEINTNDRFAFVPRRVHASTTTRVCGKPSSEIRSDKAHDEKKVKIPFYTPSLMTPKRDESRLRAVTSETHTPVCINNKIKINNTPRSKTHLGGR